MQIKHDLQVQTWPTKRILAFWLISTSMLAATISVRGQSLDGAASPIDSNINVSARCKVASNAAGRFAKISETGGLLRSGDGVHWIGVNLEIRTFLRDVTFGNGLFVAVGGSYVDAPEVIFTSRDGVRWIQRNSPTKKVLRGVAFGHGIFVAVGDDGAVITSKNGIFWKSGRIPDCGMLTAIAYSGRRFVAVGELGTVATSADGYEWKRFNLDPMVYFSRVELNASQFVVVSANGTYISSDPNAWTLAKD